MKRLLYLYPEEWTGQRAREIHTLNTCLALASAGVEVSLVTAGGLELEQAVHDLTGQPVPKGLEAVGLSRRFGLIKSAGIFARRFRSWQEKQLAFHAGFVIHLKAAALLREVGLPYWWEAHEVFAETPPMGSDRERELESLERPAWGEATGRIATSQALAEALNLRYAPQSVTWPYHVVPHGGAPAEDKAFVDTDGPLVYAGSLQGWKGLPLALEAAADLNVPVRLIGGSEAEWQELAATELRPATKANVDWRPRVAAHELRHHLAGCRAGLCPTVVESGSGRYSLPMKLFDYAGAGLPVFCTALPSLEGIETESWCAQIHEASFDAWRTALGDWPLPEEASDHALAWAARHTWALRGQRLASLIFAD